MKNNQPFKIIKIMIKSIFTGLFLAALVIFSCKKDVTEDEAPKLPPLESFLIDFSDFDNLADTLQKSTLTHKNWVHAFYKVSVWNLIITVSGAVPVTAFLESFNHEPVYEGESTWGWTYDYTIGSATYTAKLTGKIISSEEVKWEMRISRAALIDPYTDFKWYEGEARFDRTSGHWILYKSPSENHELIRIDWTKDWNNNTGDIKYTNIVPGGPENGGYISYGIVDDPVFDAFYKIYNKGEDNLTDIEWNRTTKEGRIKDPKTFGDELWHCWNILLMDIDCP